MKKYLCLLLALIMVLASFAACGGDKGNNSATSTDKGNASTDNGNNTSTDNGNNTSTDNGNASTDATASTDDNSTKPEDGEDVVYHEKLNPAVDMGGREFNILQRWFGYGKESIDFQGEVIWDESDESGTMTNINLAKRQVLEAVQKDYNCTIVGEMSTDTAGNIRTFIQEDILSGAPTIDFCFETYYYYHSFIENGYLTDLNTLGIDFTKPWWDQNGVEDLSVCNKLYYALGDINTYDNDGTVVMLFNKDLYEEKFGEGSYQEIYDLAKSGNWTFDVLEEKVKSFGSDSNGDNVRDEFDTYGLSTELANLYMHVVAAGEKAVGKDVNDDIKFTLESERVFDSVTDAVELYMNNTDVLVTDLPQYLEKYGGTGDRFYEPVCNAFKEGRSLFFMCALIHLPYFRDMEDDFGILPVPKYDDTQDRYYHTMGVHTASVVFVPATTLSVGDNGKQIGIILDALGAYSKDYLTPEYYDKQLKRGDASDPDSAEMLDIIFESRTFDLGAVFGQALSDPTNLCTKLDKNIQSRVQSNKDLIEISIEEMMDKLKSAE